MNGARLLIVEDDPTLRGGLVDAFELEGFAVSAAIDGIAATQLALSESFDVVLLDVMLPGKGGLEVLRDLRAAGQKLPVLLLTARGDENDRVFGLELGADDYVTKPFSLRELVARVRALLRREARWAEKPSPERVKHFELGAVDVDLAAFEIRRGDETLPLTPKEALMLELLYASLDEVVPRERFLEEVWGGGETVTPRTVDTHMLNLRQKVELDPKSPRHLTTVHGVGYRLRL